MSPQDMAERRIQLLRKRWDGAISSDEQDELDDITDALRILSGQWSARHRELVTEDIEA
jgi:hypothetical protein